MNWIALLKGFLLCLIPILLIVFSVTKRGRRWFESLKQPRFSFSFKVWYIWSGLYYLVCGFIGYRLFAMYGDRFTLPIYLLGAAVLYKGIFDFLLFRRGKLKQFYFALYPWVILWVCLIITFMQINPWAAGVATLYLFWMYYDLYYFYTLWKLNVRKPREKVTFDDL